MQKNIDKLTHYISQFHKLPDVIAITKTKLRNDTIYNNIDIAKYNYIHADSLTKEGGVGFYIKNSLSYTVKPEYDLNLNFVENIWIQVDTDKNSILIGVIYCHPVNIVNQLELFSRTIEEKFFNLSNSKSGFYILGDFNIDLLQVTNNRVIKNYADNLVGYSIKCTINKPTRIFNNSKTLLDHIYTNCCYSSAISGIALNDIFDHFPTFIYLSNRDIKKINRNILYSR